MHKVVSIQVVRDDVKWAFFTMTFCSAATATLGHDCWTVSSYTATSKRLRHRLGHENIQFRRFLCQRGKRKVREIREEENMKLKT
jgi:hypothetical protein